MAEKKKKENAGSYAPLRDELSKDKEAQSSVDPVTEALFQPREYSKSQPGPPRLGLSHENVVLGWHELPGESISGHALYKYDSLQGLDEAEQIAKKYEAAGVTLYPVQIARLAYATQARERLKSGHVPSHLREAMEKHAKYSPELDGEQASSAKKAGLPFVHSDFSAEEISRRMQESASVAPRKPLGHETMTANQRSLQRIAEATPPTKKKK